MWIASAIVSARIWPQVYHQRPGRSLRTATGLGASEDEISRRAVPRFRRRLLRFAARLKRSWTTTARCYGLALSLISLRRHEEAVGLLKRNTKLRPMGPYGGYQLALFTNQIGRAEETQRILDHLATFEPKVSQQLERYVDARLALHDTLSGPATKVLLTRAHQRFGDRRYVRLSAISVSHLYNLRASDGYRKQRLVWTRTRPSPVRIGVRKAPAPQGLPGYIRIDTVHQGEQDGLKGV